MRMNAPVLDDMYPGEWFLVLDKGVAYDVEPIFKDVLAGMQRAIEKHGLRQTPAHPQMENLSRLAILGEEFGEAAGALTYDKIEDRPDGFKLELEDVACVALMSLLGLRMAAIGEEIRRGQRRAEGDAAEGAQEAERAGGEGGARTPRPTGGGAGSPGGDGAGAVAGRAPGRRAGEPRQWYE